MAVVIESAKTVGIPSSIGSYGTPRLGVTVHYIGASSVRRGPHSECRKQVRGWHNYHRNGNGWAGIGYNFLICHHGIVMTGRGLNRVGAHNSTANSTYQGVCFMIGGNQQPTSAQLKGFRDLMSWMRSKGVNTGNIKGHRNHISTSCPGNVLYARVRSGNWGAGGSVTPVPGGGSSGGMTSVRSIRSQQQIVNAAGYSPKLDVDGIFGPKTDAGVKWYQRKIGTTADGLWGPNTESAHKKQGGGSTGRGMTSVRSIRSQQQIVNAAGYSPKLDVDGIYGPKTEAGVKWYQRRIGTTADGLWGPNTESAHKKQGGSKPSVSVPNGSPLLRRGSKGTRVKNLQKALVAAGETLPRYGADGHFGAETEAALRSFQRKAGIGVDGIYGNQSASALRKAVK